MTTGQGRQEAMSLLQACAPFHGLDEGVLADLAALSVWRSWSTGETVFQRGEAGNHLIILRRGRLRLSLVSAAGKEVLLGTVGPGGMVGEVALIDGQPRSADAAALEPAEGLLLRRDGFLAAMSRQPQLGLNMARYLCTLLRNTNFQMESIALHDLRARLVRFVLLGLRQAHGESLPPRAELRVGLTQGELSALLGASRPKLNRALHELIDEGALSRKGDTLVCDVTLLRQIADESGATED
ncbi:Crp/Fnr family transcriptional regulator [Rhodobacteraceae bacterium HSP-20]|uniref:Crp/Fnr family transcriptional regulator n=1 Tax=Paragemmobacter amnigenus TaxID=2852097 RepID=A0ABS6IYK2_9RHOB|nr:Crp/Fnr family transcriptional regulator [Rhodobacter amnigenus]MBV4387821.1 Crp/Fnr family transcriptional regulator [Rhodobacter amnigenus]